MPTDVHADSLLTRRQRRVVNGLAQGQTDKEIAAELGVSYRTVTSHVHIVLKKLHARTRAQAVAEAMRRGEIQ